MCIRDRPVTVQTMDSERYYQTIIDDYTHFVQVYLLKSKSEAERNLMDYIRELKANGYSCSRIRTDCGGEFSSKVFQNYCRQKGIRLESSLPHTPQQNGVSERINFMLMSKTRTLLAETNLPKYLWGEAIRLSLIHI